MGECLLESNRGRASLMKWRLWADCCVGGLDVVLCSHSSSDSPLTRWRSRRGTSGTTPDRGHAWSRPVGTLWRWDAWRGNTSCPRAEWRGTVERGWSAAWRGVVTVRPRGSVAFPRNWVVPTLRCWGRTPWLCSTLFLGQWSSRNSWAGAAEFHDVVPGVQFVSKLPQIIP